MSVTYKKAGVDVERAEDFVRSIKKLIKGHRLSNILAFGSLFDLKGIIKNYKNPLLVSSCDGVGTKLKIAQDLDIHNTVGIDLVAMNVNDLICLGARPLFFLDYIACGKLKPRVLEKVVSSIGRGLKQSDCLLLGGETAEMPGMYKKDEYDLAGFCVGIVDKDKIIDGRNIKQGDLIIGLESSGLHSNGFSLVRKVFSKTEIKKYSQELLKPTRIYVKPILSLLSNFDFRLSIIKGIAHNTGGAFYTKLTKILPQGLGFKISKNSWRIPGIFRLVQKKAGLDDKEMYSTFNMGIGMILTVDRRYTAGIIRSLKRQKIKAHIIGEIIESDKKLILD